MKLPEISDSEWEVMNVIWGRSPLTASEIVDMLAGKKQWSPRTVKTLLNRLVKKKALAYEVTGNRYLYRPNIAREFCVRHEGRSFMNRVFGGAAGAMLAHFVEDANLSLTEIENLKKILNRKGKQ